MDPRDVRVMMLSKERVDVSLIHNTRLENAAQLRWMKHDQHQSFGGRFMSLTMFNVPKVQLVSEFLLVFFDVRLQVRRVHVTGRRVDGRGGMAKVHKSAEIPELLSKFKGASGLAMLN